MANQIDGILLQLYCENKPRTKTDVSTLLHHFNGLTPKIGTLIHNDGMETKNLCLSGTVPIVFQGVKYNIPVDIYVSARHPLAPPTIFVRPTPNMIVKPGHTSVEMDGTVRLQYLETWCLQHQQQGGNSSSLVELVQIMALAFSHEPPLFTRPPGYSLQQPPGHAHPANTGYSYDTPTAMATVMGGGSVAHIPVINGVVVSGTSGGGSGGGSLSSSNQSLPRPISTSTYGRSIISGSGTSSGGVDASRAQLERDVGLKLHRELFSLSSRLKKEIDDEFRQQHLLSVSHDKLLAQLQTLQTLKTDMAESLLQIETQTRELESWCKEKTQSWHLSSSGSPRGPDYTTAEYLEPYDPLTIQLLQLKSEVKTYNDMIYYTEKAQQNGHIDTNTCMKEIRKLAKLEFLCRLHLNKIHHCVTSQLSKSQSDLPSLASSTHNHNYSNNNSYYMNTNNTNSNGDMLLPLPPHDSSARSKLALSTTSLSGLPSATTDYNYMYNMSGNSTNNSRQSSPPQKPQRHSATQFK